METLKHSALGAMIGNQQAQPGAAPLAAPADAIPSGGGRSIGPAADPRGYPRNGDRCCALVKPVRFLADKSNSAQPEKIEKTNPALDGAGVGREPTAGLGLEVAR